MSVHACLSQTKARGALAYIPVIGPNFGPNGSLINERQFHFNSLFNKLNICQ